MNHFHYVNDTLYCEEVPVDRIAADVGTPFYLYAHATLRQHLRAFDDAFQGLPHLTCFAMKANSNQAILRLFGREGAGVDIVSGGELYRALAAGIPAARIVYSGVGKRAEDLKAALEAGILLFNTESPQEIRLLNRLAGQMGKRAPMAIRVNPDVNPQTHPYISTGLKENKFGIAMDEAVELYTEAARLPHLDVCGISCHIGSQLTAVKPFVDTLDRLKGLAGRLAAAGIDLRYLDLGGGLGITYRDEEPPHPRDYAAAVRAAVGPTRQTLILEPGRVIVGNAGILVTRVLYTKRTAGKVFYIVDAAMNDLIRPSLYNSYHGLQPVERKARPWVRADVVGPICESGDFLAKDREMISLEPGELLAVMSAGAYGFSMASTYNSRPRPCEVMVRGTEFHQIRARETYADLIRGERIPDFLAGPEGSTAP